MLPPSSMLLLVIVQSAPLIQPPTDVACKDLQHIELALAPAAAAREICISPGLMTNFIFDTSAAVDLQDEVRFLEVTRGRSTLSLLPPRDLILGERLRLTALLGEGDTQQRVTLSLVAHSGQATHQVEVYRDQRPRESLLHEIAQEQAKNQQLREELRQTRAQLEQARVNLEHLQELRNLIANKVIRSNGVRVKELRDGEPAQSGTDIAYMWGIGYRADMSIAAEVWLKNPGSEPWTATGGSLVDDHGRELRGMKLRQDNPIAPNSVGLVIVEANAMWDEAPGELTLTLRDEGSRSITIPRLKFP